MAKPRVYIETSVVSYLRRRPSEQIVAAARQVVTRRWWEEEGPRFELVTSQFVLDEAAQGDPELAKERLAALSNVQRLELKKEAEDIATLIVSRGILPAKAKLDAAHLSLASVHHVDYLLTWNFAHLANVKVLFRLRNLFAQLDLWLPMICTPEEVLSDGGRS